jgi:hypothetical protein
MAQTIVDMLEQACQAEDKAKANPGDKYLQAQAEFAAKIILTAGPSGISYMRWRASQNAS